jgi:hypothetical protein
MYIFIYVYTYVCMYIFIYVYTYVCMYVHIYVCMYDNDSAEFLKI